MAKYLQGDNRDKYARMLGIKPNQLEQDIYTAHLEDKITVEEIQNFYNNIELPKRATIGSAGYDFKIPFEIKLNKDETFKIPTGVRVIIDSSWVLLLFPRSSLGFKYRMQLDNLGQNSQS